MNLLRKSKIPIPQEFRHDFPGYKSLCLEPYCESVYPRKKDEPKFKGHINVHLVPKKGGDYKMLTSLQEKKYEHNSEVVSKARILTKSDQFANNLLGLYVITEMQH